ncbi:hypothetical protein KR059_007393, partial [Drosophila kikkawai]
MTSLVPILLASFVHLTLHTTLFIQLDPEVFRNTPILGSQLFYLAVLDLLFHCQVIPGHWNSLPLWAKAVLESIAVILISEMALAVVWISMETYLIELITGLTAASGLSNASSLLSERLILEIITVMLSVAFTVVVAVFTNQPSNVQQIGRK